MSRQEPQKPEGLIAQPVREPQPGGGEIFGIHVPPLPESLIPIVPPNPEDLIPGYNYARRLAEEDIRSQIDHDDEQHLDLVEPPSNVGADYSIALFKLAKEWNENPTELAQRIAEYLRPSSYVEKISAKGPYINFELGGRFYERVIEEIEMDGDRYGAQDEGAGKVVVIDTSSPNIAKFMSVGHLRSTVIGESLSRIYRKLGYTIIRDNHLGDWGTQFGMLGEAVARWGDQYPGIKGDNPVDALYELYKKMTSEIEREQEEYLEAHPDVEKDDIPPTSLEIAGRDWFKRLEEGDAEALELWKWASDLSMLEFQKVYDLLGVEFEYALGESHYTSMLPDVINSLVERGVVYRETEGKHEGALVADLEDAGLKKKIVQKSDGTSLYITRDLATIAGRTLWFAPERILYVVGGDQIFYFQQTFEVAKRLAQGEKVPELEHVYFGMISLPEGKMSTRKGRVIFLEGFLNQAINRAAEIIKDHNDKLPEADRLSDEEVTEVSKKVGVGAVIFFDLGQGRDRNIKFDMEAALSFEGTGAPYIQYAYARAQSILRKAEKEGIEIMADDVDLELESEKELVKHLSKFPQAISKAAEQNRPNLVADHVYASASLFNRFYKEAKVLAEEDRAKRNARLRLVRAAAQVIKNGLDLLGIEVPERM